MVMEPPSPQCVGREFVRQYYTVLNKAPLFLHRFYSSNSSFVHGGLDHPGEETKPVVGQTEIHQKIMQLNFRDCHAKIRQVDSHATLSDGVVVQVTGELSNGGEPMRRFMQTFVLAPQTPKKYYVRNDIFRYQDEVFNDDEETDNQDGITGTDNQLQVTQPMMETQETNKTTNYYEKEIVRNGTSHVNDNEINSLPPVETPTPELTGSVIEREPTSSKSEWDSVDEDEDDDADEEVDEEEEEEDEPEKETRNVVLETQDINIQQIPIEHKTYANMVSKNAPPSGFNMNPASSGTPASAPPAFGQPAVLHHQSPPAVQPISPQQQVTPSSTGPKQDVSFTKLETSNAGTNQNTSTPLTTGRTTPPNGEGNLPNSGNHMSNQQSGSYQPQNLHFQSHVHGNHQHKITNRPNRYNSGNRPRLDNRDTTPSSGGSGNSNNPTNNSGNTFNNRLDDVNWDGEKRKPPYPDSQQLFVGNLPHCIGEDVLKELFGKFGNVVDMRINTKQMIKNNPAGKGTVPNFGFVVFDDTDAVQKALESRPVLYNNHRLNVEEKKTRQRPTPTNNDGGRFPSGRGGMMPRGGGLGGRGRGGLGMQGAGRGESRGGGRGNLRR